MTLASREVVHRGARTVSEWGAPAVAGGLALLTVVVGWRGTDLAAQVFRADLFRRYGFVLWNSQWFGGHEYRSVPNTTRSGPWARANCSMRSKP